MFCKYCGKELRDGAKFCSGCGKQLQTGTSGVKNNEKELEESLHDEKKLKQKNNEQIADKKGKNVKIIALVVSVLAMLAIVVALVVVLGTKNKDTKDMSMAGTADTITSGEAGKVTTDFNTEDEAATNDENESDYIISKSSTEYLTRADLEGLDAAKCRLARNEIYARHGRKFDDESLQEYFTSKSWYSGYITKDDWDETILSEIEIANRDLIVAYEAEMGYR